MNRLHFAPGVAAEHISGTSYRWVNPVSGDHISYVVAQEVTYESTLDAQLARSRRNAQG